MLRDITSEQSSRGPRLALALTLFAALGWLLALGDPAPADA